MMQNETLAERLVRLRMKAKLTQRDVGLALGITDGAVSHWERMDGWKPSIYRLTELARLYGVTVDELLRDIA